MNPLPLDYKLVLSTEGLGQIANEIADAPIIALDLETTGFKPYNSKIRLCSINTGRGVYVIDRFQTGTFGPVADALQKHKGVCVGQNIVFDVRFLLEEGIELQRMFDTYRASALIHNGREGMNHDLYTLMRRELNVAPQSLELGGSDWTGVLTQEQLDYSAEDVIYLPALRERLREKLIRHGLVRVAQIEFEAMVPEAAIANKGFRLNGEKWVKIARENVVKEKQLREELMRELPTPFDQLMMPGLDPVWNLGSSPQLLESLHRMGAPVESTDKIALATYAADFPGLKKLADWKKVRQRVSSFGEKYIEHIGRDGRVRCDYFPMLKTGRYSALRPNMSQIPREAIFRECWEAEEGMELTICDWSNIEMRIAAEVSGDRKMIQLFVDEKDAHYYLASILAGVPENQIKKDQRQQAKPINFGLLYGMSPETLIEYALAGYGVVMSLPEAQRFHDLYFTVAYPGLKPWHNRLLREGKRHPVSRSIAGRLRHLDPDKHHNEFLNTPVQSTGADGLKRALRVVYDRLRKYNGNAYIVHHVHDEIITEHEKNEELERLIQGELRDGMNEAMAEFLHMVPVVAEPGSGADWSAK